MKEVSQQALLLQRDFMKKIKIENDALGRKPLAFVETYGCAQNENDSERLKGMLLDMGYGLCDSFDAADLVLFNTCSVRENADFKVFGSIGALKNIKANKPHMLIGVCGCMAQQQHIAEQIRQKYKHVDMVFGTHSLYKFPEVLDGARHGIKKFFTDDSVGEIAEGIPIHREKPPLSKVSIMYGCNNFCTYCIVPYVRGRERSRDAKNILEEVRLAAAQGYKEVMLLGQNVNSYGKDNPDGISFAQLLSEVCRIDGIERIRFMTSHPKDISDELIYVMAKEKKICKQLHLPVQSGSNRVLEKMNRKYTREKYLDIIKRVKDKMPDIVLSTDIIVGFPGETNEDFEDTMSLLKDVQFDTVFSFIYSKRKGTPAAEMDDVLTDEEKHKNFDRMLALQNGISKIKNDAYLGRRETVLVESISRTNQEFLSGRTEGGKIVNFRGGEELVGSLLDVEITECKTWSLMGRII